MKPQSYFLVLLFLMVFPFKIWALTPPKSEEDRICNIQYMLGHEATFNDRFKYERFYSSCQKAYQAYVASDNVLGSLIIDSMVNEANELCARDTCTLGDRGYALTSAQFDNRYIHLYATMLKLSAMNLGVYTKY